jgi:hypothetical protein
MPGEGGYWRYDPFSGMGGAESYTFNDEKYEWGLAGEANISSWHHA